MNDAAKTARTIASSGGSGRLPAWQQKHPVALYATNDPLDSINSEKKVELLRLMDRLARDKDPRVKQVIASLAGSYTTVLIAGLDGPFSADLRP